VGKHKSIEKIQKNFLITISCYLTFFYSRKMLYAHPSIRMAPVLTGRAQAGV